MNKIPIPPFGARSYVYHPCLIVKGLNYWKIIRINFFEPLTQFRLLLMETTPFLCVFGTVNINEATLPDKKVNFALYFTIQILFEGFIILLKEFKVSNNEV